MIVLCVCVPGLDVSVGKAEFWWLKTRRTLYSVISGAHLDKQKKKTSETVQKFNLHSSCPRQRLYSSGQKSLWEIRVLIPLWTVSSSRKSEYAS